MTDAIAIVTNILDANWTKAPKPSIQDIANLDKGDGKRVRLQDKDVIRIFETAHNEAQPELLYDFVNEHINLTLDIRTVKSRERLSELRNEVRRILHGFRKGDGINFDRIIFKTRTDLSDRTKKLFRYTMQCELITFSLTAESETPFVNPTTNVVTGASIYQTLSTKLTELSLLTPTDGQVIVGNGNNWITETIGGDITSVVAGTGLSGGGTTGDVTLNVSGLTVSQLAASSIQVSSESFADNDTTVMTSAAIQDKILAYGYSTLGLKDEDNFASNSDTHAASQQSIKAYVDAIVGGAPGALDTLNELAAAINDDASFASTITTSIGTKLAKASNLSDLANAGTARSNLGLGSMAVLSAIDISSHTNLVAGAGLTLSGDTLSITDDSIAEVKLDVTNSPTDNYILSYDQASGGFTWIAPASVGENNQNAFSTIAVSGQTSVAADSATDTLTLVGGTNVTITTTAGSDTVTFTATDTNTEYSVGDGGLTQNNFTNTLKSKLDGIAASSNNYSLPTAASNTLGGIKVGTNLSINGSGVLSSTDTNTQYSVGDGGLTQNNFTNTLKSKLDGIEASANVTDAANVKSALGGAMGSNALQIGDGNTTTTFPGDIVVTGDTTYSNETIQIVTDNTLAFRAGDGDAHEILLTASNATGSDKTITLPNTTGTVALTSQLTSDTNTQNVFTSSFVDSTNDILLRLTKSGASSGTQDIKFVAGTNVTLTHTDANNITITSTDTNTTYSIGDGGLTQNNFTNTLKGKLDGIAASANNYTHPNHSGEVTSSADGATVIASNVVDEDNLKVTNTPTDNYILSYDQASGGFTWIDAASAGGANQNAFSNVAVSGQTTVSADASTDTLTLAAGSNVTITTTAGTDTVTIASTDTNTTYSVGAGGLTQQNFTTTLKNKLDAIAASATNTVDLTVDGTGTVHANNYTNTEYSVGAGGLSQQNFTTTLKNKLDAIEASATADQTNAEIRALVESASDSNVFTDADHSKLNAIEASATADQTNAEIRAAVEAATDSNVFTDTDHSKLNAIEASADVTDKANITAALATLNGDESLVLGDSGDDTTIRVRGNLIVTGTTTTENVETLSTSNGVVFEGSAANDFEVLLKANTVSADRTIVLPNADGTISLTDTDTQNVFTSSWVDSTNNALLRLTKSGASSGTQDLTIVAGSNITLTPSGANLTIAATDTNTVYALTNDLASSEITAIQNIGSTTITATQWGYLGAASGAITNTDTVYTLTNDLASSEITAIQNIGATTITATQWGYLGAASGAITNTDTVYTHPNHSGEVTSSADGATVIADNVVDEANLKATNSPTDNYLLSYDQATGGFTWIAASAGGENNQNAFSNVAVSGQSTAAADTSTDTLTLVAAGGMTITTSGDSITLNSANTNTTYSAGIGIALSGTTFALTDPANLSALDESTDATDDKILLWDESASEWKHMTLDNLQDSIDTTATGGAGEAFKTIAVSGQSSIVADGATDTLTVVGGSNVTVTTNATSDTITIAATDTNTVYALTNDLASGEITQLQNIGSSTISATQWGYLGAASGAITNTDTTYAVMGGGNSYAAGLVVTGSATHGSTFLRKDGEWATPTDTNTQLTLKDEDNMASNSATAAASQQSIKAYVDAEVATNASAITAITTGAPSLLNTLDELAAALGDDANFATTTATSLGQKLVKTSNLSDLANAGTARSNLGLGTGAVLDTAAISDGGAGLATADQIHTFVTGLGYVTANQDTTGNAGSVTNGVYTTGNQTIGGVKTFSSTITGSISGSASSAAVAGTVSVAVVGSANEANRIMFLPDGDASANAGNYRPESDIAFTYNPSNDTLIVPKITSSLTGDVVGNVTGNASGSAGTVTTIGNLTGEVTSSNRATVIAANVVDEANLKVSNTPSDNQVLSYNAATGGFTWINDANTDTNTTYTAGTLLDLSGTTFNVDLSEAAAAAVAVANDHFLFLDGGATGVTKKESIADLATAMAGTNVTATNGVFSVAANTDTNTQNVFISSFVDSTNDAILRLTKSGASSGTQDLKFVAGSNITITPSGANLTIAATDTNTVYALTNDLASGEITQLQNIGSATISAAQWGYLGAATGAITNTDTNTTTTADVKTALGGAIGSNALQIGDGSTTTTFPGSIVVTGTTTTANVETTTVSNGVLFESNASGSHTDKETKLIGVTGLTSDITITLPSTQGTLALQNADTTGLAGTATALATARNFSITGDITASAISFNGTNVVTLDASIDANTIGPSQLKITGNGSTSQFLRSDGDGTFSWVTPTDTNTTYAVMGGGNSYAAGLVVTGAASHGSTFLRKDGEWATPTNTTYSVGAGGLTQQNFTTTLKNKLDAIAASANNYTLPEANATTKGGLELFSNTDQSVAATAVSATAARTYGLQLNSAGQGVVNVPWVDTNTTYSVGAGGLTQQNFTTTLKNKLDAIAASANNYVHPNHSGEVTSSADGATVIADNVVDEANLKATNAPTDNYLLSYDEATTGFTWIAAGAGGENNQNAFSNIAVSGQSTAAADSATDTLTLVAAGGMTITTSGDTVTLSSADTNTTYSVGAGGLTQQNFTTTLKNKLDAIAASANNYTLPEANATTKGGIELFSNTDQSVAATAVSSTASRTYGLQLNSAGQGVVNVPWVDTNTTYSVGAGGLTQQNFTTTLKNKLDAIAASANNYALTADLASGEITQLQNIGATTISATQWGYLGAASGAITNSDTNTQNIFTSTWVDSSANAILRLTKSGASTGTQDLTIVAGSNITLTPSGGNLTIAATDTNTTYSVGAGGLTQQNFTTTLKNKLDAIAASANNYSLPTAAAGTLGGIKVGANLTISSGVLAGTADTNTTYAVMGGGNSYAAGLVVTGSATHGSTFLRKDGEWATPTNTDTNTQRAAGTLLDLSGNTLNVDLSEAVETAVVVANDYFLFLDGGATGVTKKESLVDLATAMAGTNVTATNGVFSVAANTDTNTQNVFTSTWVDSSANAVLRLTKSGASTGTQDLTIVAGSNVTLTPVGGNLTIAATDTNTTYSVGAGGLTQQNFTTTLKNKLDGIAASATATVDLTTDGAGTVHANNYTNTTYSVGAGGLTQQNFTTTLKNKLDAIAASANNYTLPEANATTRGGIELFSATDQSVAATAVSSTASRTYGLQLNTSGQGVVNVPWVNTTYSVGAGGLSQQNFTTTLKNKLDAIAASATATVDLTVDGAGTVHANNYTNTTYSVGAGGLTQQNFTTTLKNKLDGIATSATANAGTVTSVTAGAGMTQSGTSTVNPTLNVIGGTGITANANDIAIDSTVATLAGTQSFTGAKTFTSTLQGYKTVIKAVSGNTVLGDADSGKTIYWTGGTLELPPTAEVGQQFVIINNTNGAATPDLGTSNDIATNWTGHAAMADETARTYICPVAQKWIYIG